MFKLKRRLPLSACSLAAAVGIALGVAPTATASFLGSTYTQFSMSCNMATQNEARTYGVTVTHGPAGGYHTFAVAFDSTTVPVVSFGNTVHSLTNFTLRVEIDGSAHISHSLSGGFGYSGTATAIRTTSTPTGNAIIEIVLPSVVAGATFMPPTLNIIQTSAVSPRLSTGNGRNGISATQNEGKYGFSAGNFHSSVLNTRTIFGPIATNVACLPTDIQFPSPGAFPVLNTGAGLLH